MKKLMTAALGVGLVIGMAGCGANSAPKPTRPNGTYEQVKHNLGGDDLGKLALSQTMAFTVRNGEPVKLYNLTKQSVDGQAFKRMVTYFATLASNPSVYAIDIYPQDAHMPVRVKPTVTDRTAAEHDFVLIPESTPIPPAIDSDVTATRHLTDQSQEISVVKQEGDKKFETTNGLAVEACQSMTELLVHIDSINGDQLAIAINNRLAQETFCNSMGEAATEIAAGASYTQYTQAIAADAGGTVSFGGNTYNVTYATLTAPQYADMQHALASS